MAKCVFCGKELSTVTGINRVGNTQHRYCNACEKYKNMLSVEMSEIGPNPEECIAMIKSISPQKGSDVDEALIEIVKGLVPTITFSEQYLEKTREERIKELAIRSANFIISTTPTIQNRVISKYIGVVDAEVVMGTGYISEFSAAISDFLGASSTAMANKLSSAKQAALSKLKEKCISAGANACVGVDFDIMTLGSNMLVASASGTAVVLDEEESL